MRRSFLFTVGAVLALALTSQEHRQAIGKLDCALRTAVSDQKSTRVIVRTNDFDAVERAVIALGGTAGRRLASIPALVAEIPTKQLQALADTPAVLAISLDRPIQGALERTAATIGARWVAENLGVDGAGIGVAIIDSGINRAHEDLSTRVAHFMDFVGTGSLPHDGYGHGTHVAGIIAGSGVASAGSRRGIAPGAHLVVLKALDGRGDGFISNAIAAVDYAIEQRAAFNIRVINLSVAAGVFESYKTDPLTLAARRAVDAGIVVVTAAGNLGRNAEGRAQYGGITAPGNAPWVLTVGATTHNGTADRSDDAVASFSSLGPSAIDLVSKPDLVAPGVGIESAADPASTLFNARPGGRLWGTIPTPAEPYLSLSGTSMAAPVVAGTVALILQANPTLTPAAVKVILQSSADFNAAESQLAQGAGFLNARAAVEFARTFAESQAAAELLDDFVVAYQLEEGTWTAPCEPGDPACRYLNAACTATPGCFEDPAGGVAGVIAPAEETILWGGVADGPRARSRLRGLGRERHPRVVFE